MFFFQPRLCTFDFPPKAKEVNTVTTPFGIYSRLRVDPANREPNIPKIDASSRMCYWFYKRKTRIGVTTYYPEILSRKLLILLKEWVRRHHYFIEYKDNQAEPVRYLRSINKCHKTTVNCIP
jgi:hypothetical protein